MLGNVQAPSAGSLNDLLTLLNVLADPATAKKNIAALKDAAAEYQDAADKAGKAAADAQAKLDAASAASAKAAADAQDVAEKAKALADAQAQLDADRKAFEDQSYAEKAALVQRKKELDAYENQQLANAKRELEMTNNIIDAKHDELAKLQESIDTLRAQAKVILGSAA